MDRKLGALTSIDHRDSESGPEKLQIGYAEESEAVQGKKKGTTRRERGEPRRISDSDSVKMDATVARYGG